MKEYIIEGKEISRLGEFIFQFFMVTGLNTGSTCRGCEIKKLTAEDIQANLGLTSRDELIGYFEHFDRFRDWIFDSVELNGEFTLCVKNSDRIREVLGYKTTLASAEKALVWSRKQVALGNTEYQSMVDDDILEVEKLKKGETGPMLFDYVTELIQENPKIHLRLE